MGNQGQTYGAEVIAVDFAAIHRARKVDKIVSAIDAFNTRTGSTHADVQIANRLREWTQSEWDVVCKTIGVRSPSRTTQLLVIDVYDRRALTRVMVEIDAVRAQMGIGEVSR